MDNHALLEIPVHLKQYIVDQEYNKYNWRDHAVWRYVMHRNLDYLSKVGHNAYLEGLEKTGISKERIPSLDEMNQILSKIGWQAVCVSGFIPPAAFMEFQSLRVLVIAADIRHLEHIKYTPAPDILHEAAGHAPIISNQVYSNYLQEFGRVGTKAFSSAKDHNIYVAIRELSNAKAIPNANSDKIKELESIIVELEKDTSNPSEMSLLRNLHWWTVEYGLIGNIENPKIYGAGLLSSIGESFEAMQPKVKKIPYSLETMNYSFDITSMQPHLFVTPDFEFLTTVLHQFAEQMAFKKGGVDAVLKAIESKYLATCELSSGIQISGVFTNCIIADSQLVYVKTNGPTELGFENKLLPNHSINYHKDGFGTPIGNLKNKSKPINLFDLEDLEMHSIEIGKETELEFLSGLVVKGKISNILRKDGKLLILSFENCNVHYKETILFKPEWGIFDMAVGEQLTSAYCGSFYIDSNNSNDNIVSDERDGNEISTRLDILYEKVRIWRENQELLPDLSSILSEIKQLDEKDWLLPFELLEIARKNQDAINQEIVIKYLESMPKAYQHFLN